MRFPTLLSTLVCSLAATLSLAAQTPKDLYDLTELRSLNLTFSSATWYNTLVANRATGTWLQANLVVDGRLYQQVGVRMTGNDSFAGTASDKKSLSISMNEFVSGQDLLGYKNLNLRNEFNDPTMLRQVLGYQLLRGYMPAPKANFVKVYINTVYWGLYSNIQQVDKPMIDEWFKGADGNRYLAEPPVPAGRGNSALQYLGSALQGYKDAYDLKNTLASAIKPWEDVRDLCTVLNNSAQLPIDLPKIFDVDQALWYLAFYNALANLNGYNSNGADYYLYHDEEHDLMTVVPWDMAGAFGASPGQTVKQATDQSPFLNETNAARPLLGKLWAVPEWRARYIHHMRTILDEKLSWTQVSPLVTAHLTLIDAAMKADTKRLYSAQNASDNLTKEVAINSGSFAKTVPGLKQLCDDRNVFLRALAEFKSTAPVVTNLVATPVDPKPNTPVIVTAKVTNSVAMGPVTLFYRSIGGYVPAMMYDDGNHGDGAANDGVYGGTVPSAVQAPGAVVQYYVGAQSAAAAGGAAGYAPKYAAIEAPTYVTRWAVGQSPISINEVMADNTNTVKDSASEFDDWLELYNDSANPVSVAGMYLTDKIANPTKWQISTGLTVPAKGTLLIWCDEDQTQGNNHANFKLSATNGEQVLLFDRDGKTVLSTLQFGPLGADESNGWLQDGKQTTLVAYKKYGTYGVGASPDAPNDPAGTHREYWPVNHAQHRQFVQWVGVGRIGSTNALQVIGGPKSSSVLMFLATAPGVFHLGGGVHFMLGGLLDGPYGLATDATGQSVVVISVPNDTSLVGLNVYFQVGGTDTQGFTVSNGAQVEIVK